MDKKIVFFVLLVIVLVLGFLEFTGQGVFLAIGNQGGKYNYEFGNIGSHVQCFDADPSNSILVKSVCHAQYYDENNKKLSGVHGIDYCKSPSEVVDFYCEQTSGCKELVVSCGDGFVCNDGACAKEENEFGRLGSYVKDAFDDFASGLS